MTKHVSTLATVLALSLSLDPIQSTLKRLTNLIHNLLQGYEVRRVNQYLKLVRKPSDDVEYESDKPAGKGYYWSREKSERWQLFIKRLRQRNEQIKLENEKLQEKN